MLLYRPISIFYPDEDEPRAGNRELHAMVYRGPRMAAYHRLLPLTFHMHFRAFFCTYFRERWTIPVLWKVDTC